MRGVVLNIIDQLLNSTKHRGNNDTICWRQLATDYCCSGTQIEISKDFI